MRAKGTFQVEKDKLSIKICDDFGAYYRWLFNRAHWNVIKLQPPKHGTHINILSPKIHKVNCEFYRHLEGQEVWFAFDVEGNYGGFNRGFLNFWMDVTCAEGEEILEFEGFTRQEGYSLLHVTIGNTKNKI